MLSGSPFQCRPYDDSEITFFIQTHNEGEYTYKMAHRIRELYENSRIVVRSDGFSPFGIDWSSIGVEFYDEEVLFRIKHGSAAVQRMMDIFLSEGSSNFLIKIDPDTVFHRKLFYLPDTAGLFGTIQELDGCTSVQGGFIGFSRITAQKIYHSRLMLRSELRDPDPNEGGYMTILFRRGKRVGLPSFDWSLGWAATVLGIELLSFSEVHCTWKHPPTNALERYAITHPDPARQSYGQPPVDAVPPV